MEALFLTNQRLKALLATIDSQEGLITDEQEVELREVIFQEEDGVCHAAMAIKEMERHAEELGNTRRLWWDAATEKIHSLERRAGRLRSLASEVMQMLSVKSVRAADKSVLVGLRQSKDGRLEIDLERFGKPKSVSGYELEAVLGNDIPLACFVEKTVYVLNKEALKAHIEAGNEVVGARIVNEPSLTIRIAG